MKLFAFKVRGVFKDVEVSVVDEQVPTDIDLDGQTIIISDSARLSDLLNGLASCHSHRFPTLPSAPARVIPVNA